MEERQFFILFPSGRKKRILTYSQAKMELTRREKEDVIIYEEHKGKQTPLTMGAKKE